MIETAYRFAQIYGRFPSRHGHDYTKSLLIAVGEKRNFHFSVGHSAILFHHKFNQHSACDTILLCQLRILEFPLYICGQGILATWKFRHILREIHWRCVRFRLVWNILCPSGITRQHDCQKEYKFHKWFHLIFFCKSTILSLKTKRRYIFFYFCNP